jgi:hypothetical protein
VFRFARLKEGLATSLQKAARDGEQKNKNEQIRPVWWRRVESELISRAGNLGSRNKLN